MADFNSLVTQVITLTNRPELVAETQLAVKSATLKLHASENYAKDLFETGLVFSSTDFRQTIDYRSLIPRFRRLSYIRKFDAVGNVPGKEFTIITPDQIFDRYQRQRTDVAYLAGSLFQLLSSDQVTNVLFGCYVHPTVADAATYSSWIATEFEYAIVLEAAVKIFTLMEQSNSAKAYAQLAMEQLAEIKMHNITTEGE